MVVDRLLVFERAPTPGASQGAEDEVARALHEACLRDVITVAARERGRVELWLATDEAPEALTESSPGVVVRRQREGDPGTRMADAFARSFDQDAERVVVLRADVPTVPEARLTAAFEDLRETDCVLGPSPDGGYYLIGLRSTAWPRAARLFRGVPWDSAGVLDATFERAAEAAIESRLLPGWYAVEQVGDLARARADLAPESHLAAWLRAHDPRH